MWDGGNAFSHVKSTGLVFHVNYQAGGQTVNFAASVSGNLPDGSRVIISGPMSGYFGDLMK
jgi:hypothetical protein